MHSCQVETRGEPTDTSPFLGLPPRLPQSSAPLHSIRQLVLPLVRAEVRAKSGCWPGSAAAPQPCAPCRPPPPLFHRTNLLIAHACPCCRSHNAVARRHEVPMPTTNALRFPSTFSVEVAEAAAARQAAAEAAAAACRAAAACAAPAVPRADSTMQEEEDASMQYASDESMLEEDDDDNKGPCPAQEEDDVDLHAAWSSWQASGGGGPAESKGKEAAEEQSLLEEEMEEEEAHARGHEPTVKGMCVCLCVRACYACTITTSARLHTRTRTTHTRTHSHAHTHTPERAGIPLAELLANGIAREDLVLDTELENTLPFPSGLSSTDEVPRLRAWRRCLRACFQTWPDPLAPLSSVS